MLLIQLYIQFILVVIMKTLMVLPLLAAVVLGGHDPGMDESRSALLQARNVGDIKWSWSDCGEHIN